MNVFYQEFIKEKKIIFSTMKRISRNTKKANIGVYDCCLNKRAK